MMRRSSTARISRSSNGTIRSCSRLIRLIQVSDFIDINPPSDSLHGSGKPTLKFPLFAMATNLSYPTRDGQSQGEQVGPFRFPDQLFQQDLFIQFFLRITSDRLNLMPV